MSTAFDPPDAYENDCENCGDGRGGHFCSVHCEDTWRSQQEPARTAADDRDDRRWEEPEE